MEPIKVYQAPKSLAKLQVYAGVALIALCVSLYFVFGVIYFLFIAGICLMLVSNGLTNKNKASVKVYESHVEIRNGNASAFKTILFEDMIRLEEKKNLKKLVYRKGEKEKKLLLTASMSQSEYEEFLELLLEKIQENESTMSNTAD